MQLARLRPVGRRVLVASLLSLVAACASDAPADSAGSDRDTGSRPRRDASAGTEDARAGAPDAPPADAGGDPSTTDAAPGGDARTCALAGSCTTAGDSCDGDTLVICTALADGCLVESRTPCASAGGVCLPGVAGARCGEAPPGDVCQGRALCAAEGRSCEGATLVTCARDADGCLVRTTAACGGGTACRVGTGGQADCLASDPCAGLQTCNPANYPFCENRGVTSCVTDGAGCRVEVYNQCPTGQSCSGGIGSAACAPATADPCDAVQECDPLGNYPRCRDGGILDCRLNFDACFVEQLDSCVGGQTCQPVAGTVACLSGGTQCGAGACNPDTFTPTCSSNSLITCERGTDGCGFQQTLACTPRNGTCDAAGRRCRPAVCGDRNIEGSEGCDDGGTAPGDGCSGSCQVEEGWTCSGSPSVCQRSSVGDTCAQAIRINGEGTVSGSNAGFNNDYDQYAGACLLSGNPRWGEGADVVYVVDVPRGKNLRIRVTDDATLAYVVSRTCPDLVNSCVAYSIIGPDAVNTGTGATTPHYIIVDGYGTRDAGAFTMTISFVSQ